MGSGGRPQEDSDARNAGGEGPENRQDRPTTQPMTQVTLAGSFKVTYGCVQCREELEIHHFCVKCIPLQPDFGSVFVDISLPGLVSDLRAHVVEAKAEVVY